MTIATTLRSDAEIQAEVLTELKWEPRVQATEDDWCTVGTANSDNRSFRLNFEITIAVIDRALAQQVQTMVDHDFAQASRKHAANLQARSFAFRFAVRAARRSAPVQ